LGRKKNRGATDLKRLNYIIHDFRGKKRWGWKENIKSSRNKIQRQSGTCQTRVWDVVPNV